MYVEPSNVNLKAFLSFFIIDGMSLISTRCLIIIDMALIWSVERIKLSRNVLHYFAIFAIINEIIINKDKCVKRQLSFTHVSIARSAATYSKVCSTNSISCNSANKADQWALSNLLQLVSTLKSNKELRARTIKCSLIFVAERD